jgi:hypothetical protein
MAGLARCDNGGLKRLANGGAKKCCLGPQQATNCNTGLPADVWMNGEDAEQFPGSFTLNCVCYHFTLTTPAGATPGTMYEAADAIAQPLAPENITCEECASDCTHRAPCESYLVSFHLTVEKWNAIFDPFENMNPASCLGPDPEVPPDTVWDLGDFEELTARSNLCLHLPVSFNGGGGAIPVDGSFFINGFYLYAQCGPGTGPLDEILLDTSFLGPDNNPRSIRTAEATVEGSYPDDSRCVGSGTTVYRVSITDISVVCADGI